MSEGQARGLDTSKDRPGTLDLHCPACLGKGSPLRIIVEGRYRLVRCRRCRRTQYFRPDPRLAADDTAASVSEYWSGTNSNSTPTQPCGETMSNGILGIAGGGEVSRSHPVAA
jgi:hypothetical protein